MQEFCPVLGWELALVEGEHNSSQHPHWIKVDFPKFLVFMYLLSATFFHPNQESLQWGSLLRSDYLGNASLGKCSGSSSWADQGLWSQNVQALRVKSRSGQTWVRESRVGAGGGLEGLILGLHFGWICSPGLLLSSLPGQDCICILLTPMSDHKAFASRGEDCWWP